MAVERQLPIGLSFPAANQLILIISTHVILQQWLIQISLQIAHDCPQIGEVDKVASGLDRCQTLAFLEYFVLEVGRQGLYSPAVVFTIFLDYSELLQELAIPLCILFRIGVAVLLVWFLACAHLLYCFDQLVYFLFYLDQFLLFAFFATLPLFYWCLHHLLQFLVPFHHLLFHFLREFVSLALEACDHSFYFLEVAEELRDWQFLGQRVADFRIRCLFDELSLDDFCIEFLLLQALEDGLEAIFEGVRNGGVSIDGLNGLTLTLRDIFNLYWRRSPILAILLIVIS